jgi:hypothetical protein
MGLARLEEEEKMKQKDKEEGMEKKRKEEAKLHRQKNPLLEQSPHKRKVSPKKPSSRKKTHTNKPQLEAMLTKDDISLVCRAIEDASEDILQRYGETQEELYGRIERELKEVNQVVFLARAVPTAPSSL